MSKFEAFFGKYEHHDVRLDAVTFPYSLDDFQKHSLRALELDHHILVTAHTGCGKTTVAEYATGRQVKLGKRVIFTTPIKALSNQTCNDLKRKYPTWSVGIRTGDIEIDPDAQVIVMTTEILRNELFKIGTSLSRIDFNQVGCVIFDEVHYMKDRERGHVWDESFMMMPANIQMVLLSATFPNATELGLWLAQTTHRDVNWTSTEQRVVPLTHYIMGPDRLHEIVSSTGVFNSAELKVAAKDYNFKPSKLNDYLNRLNVASLLPAFFFCFSRKKCREYAHSISSMFIDSCESSEVARLFDNYVRLLGKDFECMGQTAELRQLVLKGVCYHHSGLVPALKEVVELILSKGLIKVLFVTETFAAGVNLPARTVVFTGLKKFDDHAGGLRYLHPEEYCQMAGRAGRRGLDHAGTVILLPFHPSETLDQDTLYPIIKGKIADLVSRFKIDVPFVLKVISSNSGRNLVGFAEESMLSHSTAKTISEIRTDISIYESELKGSEWTVAFLTSGFAAKYCGLMQGMKINKNERVKTLREFDELPQAERKKITQAIALRGTREELRAKIATSTDELYAHENFIRITVKRLLTYLYDQGYLCLLHDEPEDFVYLSDSLTVKGLIASQINECNPILLTELLTGGLLSDLSTDQVLGVLGLFISDKEEEDDRMTSSSALGLSSVIEKVNQLVEQLASAESKHGLAGELDSYWNLSRGCVEIAMLWGSGCSIADIYAVTSMHEGNFVRCMLKLRSICESIISICELPFKGCEVLRKKLERYEVLIVRGIVTPESLHLRLG